MKVQTSKSSGGEGCRERRRNSKQSVPPCSPQDDSLGFEVYPSDRIKALAGMWRGEGSDGYVENQQRRTSYRSQLHVRVVEDKIEGGGVIYSDADPSREIPVVLEGGFLSQDLLIAHYRSSDAVRKQLGSLMLRLSDCGAELTGSYNGNSPVRSSIVNGHIRFRKAASL